jgi:hypothetical protein
MPLKAAKFVSSIVVFLMVLEIVGAAVTALPADSNHILSYHTKKSSASVFDAFLFEKAEEETEKSEDEKSGSDRALLVDFSCIAHTLSIQFIPKVNLTPFAFHYNVRPPVYTLNCVFII